eukprot:TRINITY_DN58179_c0_g1_i1.p2 TRINITY_DN58179_c0_g1~~TRINITY_DN58179_c0_g1_i1.p2  ORF type:complete len:144 (-),score=19.82 TRINITY_DN58179_c0_g1_i1:112-543(-)
MLFVLLLALLVPLLLNLRLLREGAVIIFIIIRRLLATRLVNQGDTVIIVGEVVFFAVLVNVLCHAILVDLVTPWHVGLWLDTGDVGVVLVFAAFLFNLLRLLDLRLVRKRAKATPDFYGLRFASFKPFANCSGKYFAAWLPLM